MRPDWYPDPIGRAQFRYYDGSAWTHHVATNGQASLEPSVLALPAFAPPAQPFQVHLPPARAQALGGGRLVAAGVLAIVTGLVTLLGATRLLITRSNYWSCADAVLPCGAPHSSLSDVLQVMARIAVALSVMFIVAGIGACMRKRWGQLAVVTISMAFVMLQIVGFIYSDYTAILGLMFLFAGAGGVVVVALIVAIPIIWFATIAGLATANRRADYEWP